MIGTRGVQPFPIYTTNGGMAASFPIATPISVSYPRSSLHPMPLRHLPPPVGNSMLLRHLTTAVAPFLTSTAPCPFLSHSLDLNCPPCPPMPSCKNNDKTSFIPLTATQAPFYCAIPQWFRTAKNRHSLIHLLNRTHHSLICLLRTA